MRRKRNQIEAKGDMTPMIDMVFQLLIFFILTLNIVDPEGDFTLNLPKPGSAQASENDIVNNSAEITLVSTSKGDLSAIWIGGSKTNKSNQNFVNSAKGGGCDPNAKVIRDFIRSQMPKGAGEKDEFEVTIICGQSAGASDCKLKYRYLVKVLGIITHERNEKNELVELVKKVKFK